jgi:hypothetical protein
MQLLEAGTFSAAHLSVPRHLSGAFKSYECFHELQTLILAPVILLGLATQILIPFGISEFAHTHTLCFAFKVEELGNLEVNSSSISS